MEEQHLLDFYRKHFSFRECSKKCLIKAFTMHGHFDDFASIFGKTKFPEVS